MKRLVALILFVCVAGIGAEDEDLGEAPVLQVEPPKEEKKSIPPKDEKWRFRAFTFLEGMWKKTSATSLEEVKFPYVEFSGSANYDATAQAQLFVDVTSYYSAYTSLGSAQANQLGARIRPTENLVLAAGRERNRRSPGLLLSPSDFLHTSQNLPGQREVRVGEWLVRASHQTKGQSTDLIYVPFRTVTTEGFPQGDPRGEGLFRHFRDIGGIDLGMSAGYLDGLWKSGASLQGFVASVWKLYAEVGYSELPVWNTLLGVGYEGSDWFTVRGEFFYASTALLVPIPVPSGWHVIVNLGFPEVADRLNFYFTATKSLSESFSLWLGRAEWILHDQHVIGTSLLKAPNDDLQWTLDWKFSL